MWTITLRDLQFRRRQFPIAVMGGSQRRLLLSLSAQAVLASPVAALLGALVAQALAPPASPRCAG